MLNRFSSKPKQPANELQKLMEDARYCAEQLNFTIKQLARAGTSVSMSTGYTSDYSPKSGAPVEIIERLIFKNTQNVR